jgi:beta-N-acetylhexosaminidase
MPRAVVLGCSGPVLGDDERRFFAEADPIGFILFGRNAESPDQLRALVSDLRTAVGRDDAPVLIDQEGGRVTRLGKPHWYAPPAARVFGHMSNRRPQDASKAAYLNARMIAADLADAGITVDCAPVLDLLWEEGHDVIGDRAFSREPAVVGELGYQTCKGLMEGGVLPVLKHLPGHGRAKVDSHEALPVVDALHIHLANTDFRPFIELGEAPWGMTAHVDFYYIDGDKPATVSPKMINIIIRQEIGFQGVLISDDLSMKALSGNLRERAEATLNAGCDLALHCNGRLDEMRELMEGVGEIRSETADRLARAEEMRLETRTNDFDREDVQRQLDGLMRE